MRKLPFVVASSAMVAMASPATMWAQDKDIVETAAANASFKTFTRALSEAGLTETLKGPGPFTVLAPSDDAFAKMPKASLDALFKDKSALRNMLLYHVIAGRLTAADFAKLNGKSKKTVEGSDAKVMMMGSTVMVGSSNIVQADIAAKNGIIHVIDAVLVLPPR